MPKITRATQQIFGLDAPSAEVTAFGTAMTNDPVQTKDPALLQTAASLLGWEAAIEEDKAPFEEDTNGLFYLITRQLAYLFQQGTAEWDSGTKYYKNSLCTVIEDNNLVIKKSTYEGENTNHNPVGDDGTYWVDYYSNRVIHTIGDPIITLNPVLENNEIWLEGATVSRTTYSNLYQVYGTTYGIGDGSTTFKLPDFRNRTVWGATDFGYIAAGLPDHRHEVAVYYARHGEAGSEKKNGTWSNGDWDWTRIDPNKYTVYASQDNPIYGRSNTVQPPSIKVRVKTRYQ